MLLSLCALSDARDVSSLEIRPATDRRITSRQILQVAKDDLGDTDDEALQAAKELLTDTDSNKAHGDSLVGEKGSGKSFEEMSKDLGLSEDEIRELKLLNRSNSEGKADRKIAEAKPPIGMVAPGAVKPPQIVEPDHPGKPHEPSQGNGFGLHEHDHDLTRSAQMELQEQNNRFAKEVDELTKSNEKLRVDTAVANKETTETRKQMIILKSALERSRTTFQRSLDTSKDEQKVEKEDMASRIEEQQRAFDELLEEKQLLSQMLSDEQKTLKDLQERIQHPDLGLWLRQRAARAAIFMETPETDAVKFYAKKYMAPKVSKMRHRLQLLERRVERTVDHLLPAKYGSFVAVLLCIGLIGFPFIVTMSTVVSVTKSVSLRQYVLLGNVFLTAFVLGLCIAGILLRQDPLQTLYEASDGMFITLQIATAAAYPVFMVAIAVTVVKSRDRMDTFVFGCEFVFYALVAMNYGSRVWRPAVLGQNIETSVMMYIVYLMDFMSMTALTISSARTDASNSSGGADPELGQLGGLGNGKMSLPSVSGAINGLRATGIGSLGSGLIQSAMGNGEGSGKEE